MALSVKSIFLGLLLLVAAHFVDGERRTRKHLPRITIIPDTAHQINNVSAFVLLLVYRVQVTGTTSL